VNEEQCAKDVGTPSGWRQLLQKENLSKYTPLLLGSYPGKILDRNPLALLWKVGDGKEAQVLMQAFNVMFFS